MYIQDNVIDIGSKELAVLLENTKCFIQRGCHTILISCKHWNTNEYMYNIKDAEPSKWKIVGCVLDGPDKYNLVAVLRESAGVKKVIEDYNAKQFVEADKIKDYC